MRLSVAICTRDRPASLRRVLESIERCRPPAADWEVLVAENGSDRLTMSVITEFGARLPVRHVREPLPGLARARNAAVAAARGDYIVWTDDDCVVDEGWLAAYADAFDRWPDAALFGGPIVPRFEGQPPAWLSRVAGRVGEAYAARNLSGDVMALSITGNRVPFGANYAIRAREQRERLYNESLGRGASLPMTVGEESEVLEGLLRSRASGWWLPQARVVHVIPAERQRIEYLRGYYAAYGAYEEWRRRAGHPLSDDQLAAPWRAELRYRLLRLVAPPEAWIEPLIAASMARGRTRARRALGTRT